MNRVSAEGNTASVRHEASNQIERAIQFWRERDDANAVAGGFDFGEDLAAAEIPRTGCTCRTRCTHCTHCTHYTHCTHWTSKAPDRLRAAKLRIDEVALEVRRQHARARLRG